MLFPALRAASLSLLLPACAAAAGEAPLAAPLELARLYAAGQRSEALARLDGWQAQDFRRDWEGLRDLRIVRGGRLPDTELRAAILLHTDRAALEWERLSPAEREGACGHSPHRDHARSLATYLMAQSDRSPESARTQDFVRRWVTAMALDGQRFGCFGQVRSWTEQATKWFPRDAVFLLIQATAVETAARLRPQPALDRPNLSRGGRRLTERAEWREDLFGAARDLETALVLDPGLDEGRLRLGRIQWQLGQKREARATLEALLARAQGSAERYLGHLFLGRVKEDAGEHAAALEHYREALALDPAAQAAAIAVAHALQGAGDVDGSRDVLRHALKQAPRADPRDAYLSYHFGRAAQYEDLLEALRSELSR